MCCKLLVKFDWQLPCQKSKVLTYYVRKRKGKLCVKYVVFGTITKPLGIILHMSGVS